VFLPLKARNFGSEHLENCDQGSVITTIYSCGPFTIINHSLPSLPVSVHDLQGLMVFCTVVTLFFLVLFFKYILK